MCQNTTCSGYCYPNQVDQSSTHDWRRMITHKINREHETFEVLAFQGIENPAFLEEC